MVRSGDIIGAEADGKVFGFFVIFLLFFFLVGRFLKEFRFRLESCEREK